MLRLGNVLEAGQCYVLITASGDKHTLLLGARGHTLIEGDLFALSQEKPEVLEPGAAVAAENQEHGDREEPAMVGPETPDGQDAPTPTRLRRRPSQASD